MQTQSKRSVVVLFAALVIGAALSAVLAGPSRPAGAQSSPPVASDLPRTITVVGEGTVALQPDVAQAQIGVDVAGDTAKQASAEAAKIMEAVLAALKAQGIATKDIQTSNYSIYADRPADPLTGRPGEQVTYRVNNGVSVTIRDLAKIGAVLDAVIDAGANNIYGVTFSVSDPDKVMAEARRKAAEDARARAEELAALHDVALGEVVSVSEVIGGSMPVPIRESVNAVMGFGGGGGNAIQPGEMKMTTQLQVIYEIAGPAGAASAPDVAALPATPTPTAASAGSAAASKLTALTAANPQPTQPLTAPSVQEAVVEQVVVTAPTPAGPSAVTVVGDDSLLRPFVERWFGTMYGGMDVDTTINLGSLPEDLPIKLPIPSGATVESSIVQGGEFGTQIVLTMPLPAGQVIDLFTERLADQGFKLAELPQDLGNVFVGPQQTTIYCSEDADLLVDVTVTPMEADAQRSDVNIHIGPAQNTPCSGAGPGASAGADRLLPHLQPPAGLQPQFSATSGGGGNQDAYAERGADHRSESG